MKNFFDVLFKKLSPKELKVDTKIIDFECVKCEGRIDSKYCDGRCVDEPDDELICNPKNSRLFDVIFSLCITLAATLGTAYMVKTNYSDQVSNIFVFCVLYFAAMFVPIFGIRCFMYAIFNREES